MIANDNIDENGSDDVGSVTDMDDLEDMSVEELIEVTKQERKQKTKIAEDYKTVEGQRNQYEGVIKNLKSSIESSGKGKLEIIDDKVRLEFNDTNLGTPPVQKTEIEQIDDALESLAQQKDDSSIDKDEYLKEVARLSGKRSYYEEKAKDTVQNKKDAAKSSNDENNAFWSKKIADDFGPESSQKGSTLLNEMNTVFEDKYKGASESVRTIAKQALETDFSKYYDLARIAKQNIALKQKSKQNPTDHYALLNSGGVSDFSNSSDHDASNFINDADKSFIEVNCGKGAAKRLSSVLSDNSKRGNIAAGDEYLINSHIYLES